MYSLMPTVFVDGLPPHFKTEHLRELGAAFGDVKSAFVATQRSGDSLGFGYVVFSSLSEARHAVNALKGIEIMGKALTIYIADSGEQN